MSDEDSHLAKVLRERAARVRAAGEALERGAATSDQERLLRLQARILLDGAAQLEDEALAAEPVGGHA
jgi:hypothetical protein